jgi:hypothetical protein
MNKLTREQTLFAKDVLNDSDRQVRIAKCFRQRRFLLWLATASLILLIGDTMLSRRFEPLFGFIVIVQWMMVSHFETELRLLWLADAFRRGQKLTGEEGGDAEQLND